MIELMGLIAWLWTVLSWLFGFPDALAVTGVSTTQKAA